jgi:hypothetical protein
MTKISAKHAGLWLCLVLAFAGSAFAQKYEIHPLVGRNLPLKWADTYSLKSVSLVGVKGTIHANNDTQIEGEFEYLPHFEFRGSDPKTRAFVYGLNLSRSFTLPNTRVIPFYTFGVGAVSAQTDGASSTTVLPDRTITLDNNDAFFSVNYGIGIKAPRVFGPVGLRANIYGRTMPNFFGRANSWAEITGGLVFPIGNK